MILMVTFLFKGGFVIFLVNWSNNGFFIDYLNKNKLNLSLEKGVSYILSKTNHKLKYREIYHCVLNFLWF